MQSGIRVAHEKMRRIIHEFLVEIFTAIIEVRGGIE